MMSLDLACYNSISRWPYECFAKKWTCMNDAFVLTKGGGGMEKCIAFW